MVYVTGDMHGDFERFKLPAMKKLKKGDTLIICGDFGFLWDGSKEEEESPSQQELIEGAENMATYNNIVDIVITHEPSAKVKEFLQMQFTEKSRVTLLNTYFEELAGAVDYRKWYFGSLHMDKHISATQVAVFTNVLEAWTGKPI